MKESRYKKLNLTSQSLHSVIELPSFMKGGRAYSKITKGEGKKCLIKGGVGDFRGKFVTIWDRSCNFSKVFNFIPVNLSKTCS